MIYVMRKCPIIAANISRCMAWHSQSSPKRRNQSILFGLQFSLNRLTRHTLPCPSSIITPTVES